MTAVSRMLRSRALASALRPRAAVPRAVAVPRTLATAARPRLAAVSVRAQQVARAYSAAAAQEVEAEAPSWPEPVLPELTSGDISRLQRQRNIGM